MKIRDMIKLVQSHGFYLIRQSGHMIYSNGSINIAIPRHNHLNGRTVHFILKKAGIK